MRTFFRLFLLVFILSVAALPASAQWECLYATYDNSGNGTGHNTPSVGLIAENTFVALVMTPNVRNFMIPYVNADSAAGRVNFVGYGSSATSGVYQLWTDGAFDQVLMRNAAKIIATSDSTVYVANNDVDRNILVFKFTGDTVTAVAPYKRQITGTNPIFGLAVDGMGYVYVCNDTTTGQTNDIRIYAPVGQWSATHNDAPVRTLDLPDGIYRGIAVTPNGQQLFVCDYGNKSVLKYKGSPAAGYTLDGTFTFQLNPNDTIPNTTLVPGPINLAYLTSNNILAVAVDAHGYTSATRAYDYGRIYFINPVTGAPISSDTTQNMINVAQWNLDKAGSYSNRVGGTTPGNASSYTSTYDVVWDGNGNLYSQSHFGWTVEKWRYNGSLPIISSVERTSPAIPESFTLEQNFPNPFNPATVIEFAVRDAGHVSLVVHDLLGRQVAVLANETMDPGTYRATFDARDLPGGIYFYTLRTNGTSVTKKMTLLK